jgi:AraC-like DNA-binding protein
MARQGSSMPSRQNDDVGRLNAQIAVMIEESKALRDVLVRNERAAAKLQRHIARTGSVIDAMEALDGAMHGPRELPEAIDRFEAIRRETRHRLFSLATKQNVSLSEMARRFGFSRQLAARIAQEANSSSTKDRERSGKH